MIRRGRIFIQFENLINIFSMTLRLNIARLSFLIFIILLFFTAFARISYGAVVLKEGIYEYPLGLNMDLFEDKKDQYSISEVASESFSHRFHASSVQIPNLGFPQSVYWVRFQVENRFLQSTHWILQIGYPLLDRISLYIPKPDGTFEKREAGDLLPFNQREINYHRVTFDLEIFPKDTQTFYLRIESESSIQLGLMLYSPKRLTEKINKEQFYFGIYYGIVLVMALYNLFIFISTRDKSYFFYVLYIISFFFTQMSLNGLSYEHLWPSSPWWNGRATPLFVGVTIFFIMVFIINFLRLKENLPVLWKPIASVVTLIVITVIGLSLWSTYRIAILAAIGLLIPCALMAFGIALFVWVKGYTPARLFFLAWMVFIVGALLASIKYLSFVPETFITEYGVQIGAAVEIILLSFALADRINFLRREKDAYAEQLAETNIQLTNEIGERKVIEKDLRFMRNKLEQQVEERTLELTQTNEQLNEEIEERRQIEENLIFTNNQLVESNEELKTIQSQLIQSAKLASIGELASGVAHELNQPIMYIRNNAQLLAMDHKKGFETESVHELLNYIESGTERMMGIINHLRTFARQSDTDRYPVSLKEIIENSLILLNEQLRVNDIEISKNYDADLPRVLGNQIQLEQVFINLLTNARDALLGKPGSTIKIETAYQKQQDGTGRVVASISDNGIGIASDKISKIFDPFFTTKEHGIGTGLGLSISYGIIRNHKGQVNVTSVEGEGARFDVNLPIIEDEHQSFD